MFASNMIAFIISMLLVFVLIGVLIYVGLIVMNEQYKPFKDCQNKTNDTIVELGGQNITCGQINNITTMEG